MKYIKISFFIILVLFASGCKKWMDINTDPANPQTASGEVLIAPICAAMANWPALDYTWALGKYVQNWGSQTAEDPYEMHGYRVGGSDDAGAIWRMVYVSFGPNIEALISDGIKRDVNIFPGIGYAIKAWGFQILTDYHGPVILNQFLEPNRLTFQYQDQEEVYKKVREWAHLSISYLDKADAVNVNPFLSGATGDQIYKGDRAKWKKFVYGLLALHFSHLKNKPEFNTAYADSVIKYADLSFSATTEDAAVSFAGLVGADSNPFGVKANNFTLTSTATSRITGRIMQPIVDLLCGGVRGNARVDTLKNATTGLTTSDDPRLSVMIAPCADSVYRGVVASIGDPSEPDRIPHVWGSVTGTAANPFPGRYLFTDVARFPLMTYSQIQFAKAEAQFIKGDKGGAYTSYLNGIRGHMQFVNNYLTVGTTKLPAISDAQVATYLTGSSVAKNSGELLISDIMSQKYIAQWGWGLSEQWCDFRKYHYDTTVIRKYHYPEEGQIFDANGGRLVQRVRPRYNSEYMWNRDELDKWGGLDLNYHTLELWFSKP